MMMLNEQDVTFEVVEPGSADDPFTARNTSSPASAPSPVQIAGGAVQMTPVGVTQTPQPQTPATPAAPAAPAAPVVSTPTVQLSPLEQAVKDGTLDDYIKTQVTKVTSGLQSSFDTRVARLEKERDEAREAVRNAQRESKLNSEDLTDEEKDILREKWKLEDERARLDEELKAADEYYKSLYATGMAQENQQFGVTVEELMGLESAEEMDSYVLQKQLDFYKSGGNVQTPVVPSGTATAAGTPPPGVPAGAVAPTDVGGSAPSTPPPAPPTGTGPDAMKEHMAQLKWETVPFN